MGIEDFEDSIYKGKTNQLEPIEYRVLVPVHIYFHQSPTTSFEAVKETLIYYYEEGDFVVQRKTHRADFNLIVSTEAHEECEAIKNVRNEVLVESKGKYSEPFSILSEMSSIYGLPYAKFGYGRNGLFKVL